MAKTLADKYYNVGRTYFTSPPGLITGAETHAERFATGYQPDAKTGFLIKKLKMMILPDQALNDAIAEGERLYYGLSFVDVTDDDFPWNPYSAGILTWNGIENIQEGTPANFFLHPLTFEHLFGEWDPSDGLLVHPFALFCWVGTPAGITTTLNFCFEIHFRIVTLTSDDYQEILHNQLMTNMLTTTI